jgi:hypothetical protein
MRYNIQYNIQYNTTYTKYIIFISACTNELTKEWYTGLLVAPLVLVPLQALILEGNVLCDSYFGFGKVLFAVIDSILSY